MSLWITQQHAVFPGAAFLSSERVKFDHCQQKFELQVVLWSLLVENDLRGMNAVAHLSRYWPTDTVIWVEFLAIKEVTVIITSCEIHSEWFLFLFEFTCLSEKGSILVQLTSIEDWILLSLPFLYSHLQHRELLGDIEDDSDAWAAWSELWLSIWVFRQLQRLYVSQEWECQATNHETQREFQSDLKKMKCEQ